MNNAKKMLFTILFLFVTVIFQIISIVRLEKFDNILDDKLATRAIASQNTVNNNSHSSSPVNENHDNYDNSDNHDNSENKDNTTGEPNPGAENIHDNQENNDKHFLFIGDSRIASFEKLTNAADYSDFFCGIGINVNKILSDKITVRGESLTLTETLSKYKYDTIVICLGFNELGWKYEDTFIVHYSELIDTIIANTNNTNIVVNGILHISRNAKVDNQYENNDRINTYNEKITALCTEKNVTYLDLNSNFCDEAGFLPDDCAADGIHLNKSNCDKYLDVLLQKYPLE